MSESNAITTFETAYGTVTLSPEVVTNYLKRGNKALTDQEITLFINLCKYQRLNPFVNEAYPIKFGDEFQMVIGYDTYKRRADENPNYRGKKSGIVVQRGADVVIKEGTCLYPTEELIGGWCRVFRDLGGHTVEEYREVSLKEYDKGQANWKTKPATMIEKVAVSQCLRAAFPKDYAGLYISEELPVPEDAAAPNPPVAGAPQNGEGGLSMQTIIGKDQRKALFSAAQRVYGGQANEKLKAYLDEHELKGTDEMTFEHFTEFLDQVDRDGRAMMEQLDGEGDVI